VETLLSPPGVPVSGGGAPLANADSSQHVADAAHPFARRLQRVTEI
jgi:hypothetical protein